MSMPVLFVWESSLGRGGGSSNYVLIPSFKMLRDVLCFENNKLLTKEELVMTPNNINLIVSFFLD